MKSGVATSSAQPARGLRPMWFGRYETVPRSGKSVTEVAAPGDRTALSDDYDRAGIGHRERVVAPKISRAADRA